MVEFALTLLVFIGVLFAALQIMLIGYNYNLAERTVWQAARAASLGYQDRQTCTGLDPVTYREVNYACGVYDVIDEKFTRRAFTGGMTQIVLTANPVVTPETPVERAEGRDVTVDLSFRGGFYVPGLGTITTITFPVKATLPIVANNDLDRDGCVDKFETVTQSCRSFNMTYPGNHTNNAATVGSDGGGPNSDSSPMEGTIPFLSQSSTGDDDGDGTRNFNDWGWVRICGNPQSPDAPGAPPGRLAAAPSEYKVAFVHYDTYTKGIPGGMLTVGARAGQDSAAAEPASSAGGTDTGPFYEGKFATRLFWITSTGRTVEDDWHWLPRNLPWGQREFYSNGDCVTLFLDLHYDHDNDGWEDKYDAFPNDYHRH